MGDENTLVPGTLYTLGYAAPGATTELKAVMQDESVLLIDIRVRAGSRWWPEWNKKQLRARWVGRYTHEKRLGNVNYRDRSLPVVLHGPNVEQAIEGAVELLRKGYSLVLLCACKDYGTCHREVVAEMILHAMKGADEVPHE